MTWLLLIHQIPAKPSYQRVKIWRRLQAIGAVAVKNAVHALPADERAAAVFRELVDEIVRGGGEAFVCTVQMVEGLSDADLRALFDATRDGDYEELAQETRTLLAADEARAADVSRLKRRRDEIAAIDFFGAHGRHTVDALLGELEDRSRRHPDVSRHSPAPNICLAGLERRVWVTRRGVHVDRIASAWLIRRFVDADATFKFVETSDYVPEPGELRFDMADAEFTHEGDRCTFETLVLRARLEHDKALVTLSEIVHELDIADGKFTRPETSGIGALIAGICAATHDDEERLARGAAALDGLYAHFSKPRGE